MSVLAARSSQQQFDLVRRSMIQNDNLPLTEILDNSLIVDVFQKHDVDFGIADEDVFDPMVTLWAMISQFLFSGKGRSCKAAAGRVVSLFAQVANKVISQNAGNYCRAKAKIPVKAIREITLSIAEQAEPMFNEYDDCTIALDADEAEQRKSPAVIASVRCTPIRGRIINVDGFIVDCPDTPAIQEKYPQNPVQKEGLGFPLVRCVSLVTMTTGMLIGLATAPYSGKGSGETSLLRQLKSFLREGDILVADSYYCTYWLLAMCNEIGVKVVMKNHHKREDKPLGARQISDTERVETLLRPTRPVWMGKREYRKTVKSLEIRLCDTSTGYENSRSDGFTIATTMLDPETATASWLASLYESRWYVETDIEYIKCTMGLEHLRSLTPEGIERELWTGLLCYNLIRLKMLQSGCVANRDIRSLSFSETYQVLSSNWLLCACIGVSNAMAESALDQGACAIVGNRPGRSEPRENKRRPKVLKLMKVPRRVAKAARDLLAKIT